MDNAKANDFLHTHQSGKLLERKGNIETKARAVADGLLAAQKAISSFSVQPSMDEAPPGVTEELATAVLKMDTGWLSGRPATWLSHQEAQKLRVQRRKTAERPFSGYVSVQRPQN